MKLLLDTHVIIWWLESNRRLGDETRRIIDDRGNEIYLSVASAWEMAIKTALGKLRTPDDLPGQMEANNIRALPITLHHAQTAGALPLHHRDPFDRMLIAQARIEGLTLITSDRRMESYDVRVLMV